MLIRGSKLFFLLSAVALFLLYSVTAPQNHSEAEDVYDFALKVEQGSFADQAGVNRVLALPAFGVAYKAAQAVGYEGRAFPFMIFMNRILSVGCVVLFWIIIAGFSHDGPFEAGRRGGSSSARKPDAQSPAPITLMPIPFLFAFSYGFWRYANEAETYVLASFLVLGSWFIVLRSEFVVLRSSSLVRGQKGGPPSSVLCPLSSVLCPLVSAFGILVHLLNLIPLLLIIPLFYLLAGKWKKGVLHGIVTGLLVAVGYAVCSPWLNFSELGAQHHALEGGIGLQNLLRGGIAFGHNMVSANFLFGFESFRELLIRLFPSRMLDEEFYMASKMPGWISWAGVATLVALGAWGMALSCRSVRVIFSRKEAHKTRRQKPLDGGRKNAQCPMLTAMTISSLAWLVLYALAVVRTEAGSAELWIMALIPLWLLVALLLHRAWGMALGVKSGVAEYGSSGDTAAQRPMPNAQRPAPNFQRPAPSTKFLWNLVMLFFFHNLIAGLLPVMSEESDYHRAKGKWVVEHAEAGDLILIDYEPIMIFYLNYFCEAEVLNSGGCGRDYLKEKLGNAVGSAYAFNSFFEPMPAMKFRSAAHYEKMVQTGQEFMSDFEQVVEDEFGGVYRLRRSDGVSE